MKLQTVFKRLGLSERAFRVYQSLGTLGPSLVLAISGHSYLHRPTVYRELGRLLELGLVTKTLSGKRVLYVPAPETVAFALFEKEVARVQKQSLVPASPTTATVRSLEGAKGIREVFDDVIEHSKRGETFYRYTSEKNLEKVNSYLSPDYRARRDKKKLERLVISNPVSASQKRSRLERFIKFIPKDMSVFDQNIIELIYGDRVAFIDLTNEKAFIIENPALADFQKVIFKQLYKKL